MQSLFPWLNQAAILRNMGQLRYIPASQGDININVTDIFSVWGPHRLVITVLASALCEQHHQRVIYSVAVLVKPDAPLCCPCSMCVVEFMQIEASFMSNVSEPFCWLQYYSICKWNMGLLLQKVDRSLTVFTIYYCHNVFGIITMLIYDIDVTQWYIIYFYYCSVHVSCPRSICTLVDNLSIDCFGVPRLVFKPCSTFLCTLSDTCFI
jgi:hypothetical protein